MRFFGIFRYICALSFLMCSLIVSAEHVVTPLGKITSTQGHTAPSCRTVQFKENTTGNYRYFRIPNNSGGQENGIAAVALTALVANRDVSIVYDPAITSGCGAEPAITYISIN